MRKATLRYLERDTTRPDGDGMKVATQELTGLHIDVKKVGDYTVFYEMPTSTGRVIWVPTHNVVDLVIERQGEDKA